MVLSGFRPMAFVSMSGERNGFPGNARTRCTSFPFLLFDFSELCISIRLQWKGVMPGSKKI